MANTRTCIECQEKFPATTEYFHKSKDGFHSRCRRCRNSKERGARRKSADKRLARIERRSVDAFIRAAKSGGPSIPHSSELLEHILTYFGGVQGFATAWMKQFYDSPVGGAFRTKMLDGVFRLVQTNTALGGAKKPLELMTEEELESELRRRVLEAAMTMQKVEVVDAVPKLPLVESGGSPERREAEVGPVQEVPAEVGERRDMRVPGDGAQ